MDTKNLAVLQKLKEEMSLLEESEPKAKTIDPVLLPDININLHGEPKSPKRPRKKRKVDKSLSEPAPAAKPATKVAARTKQKSPWPEQERLQRAPISKESAAPISKAGKTSFKIRAECSRCQAVCDVDFARVTANWICGPCRSAYRKKKADEAKAKAEAQYEAGAGTKVSQIERKIASIKALLESGNTENPRGLMLQIDELEKQLKLEKVHAISKFSRVRARQLPGSYGSSK